MSYGDTLRRLSEEGNFRRIPDGGRREGVIDLSLNDYLGLATRTDLQEAFFSDPANRRIAMTSSAARLLAADQEEYFKLEQRLSELYAGRPVLLFNSGYHANAGLVSALASEKGTVAIADKLVHASIIDGLTLSKKPFHRFLHNDMDRLERLVERESQSAERVLVIVESVYSMDGDQADINVLVELKRRHPKVMLYVDEAHAFGVLGPQGLGVSRGCEGFEEIDVVIGTLGKACASSGAFAVLTPELRDYAVNRSRSFIFSTAIPPINCAWTRFMVDTFVTMDPEREHLQQLSNRLAEGIAADGEPRYIRPVIVGSSERALQLSARLLDEGFKVLPIRTPTVPPGTERLRISLSAAMKEADIGRFVTTLRACL